MRPSLFPLATSGTVSRWGKLALFSLLGLLGGGCEVSAQYDGSRFACEDRGSCPPGFECTDRWCQPAGVLPGGEDGPDAASVDEEQSEGDEVDAGAAPAIDAGPRCGNGVVEPGEDCDDGNVEAGDGCTSACVRCAAPSVEVLGHCYSLAAQVLDWEAARAACAAAGEHLVAYQSAAELAGVLAALPLPDDAWIGLHKKMKVFQWVTDEPLTFTAWEPGQPSGNGECVEEDVATRQWNDYDCADSKPFVCEREPGAK